MNLKVIFIAIALAVVVASAAVLEARTHSARPLQTSLPIAMQTSPAPAVGTPNATPALITVNTPSTLTVSIQITGTVLPGGVNLLRLGPTGTQPTILGVMHDDGLNGDAVANDGFYTLQVPFNEASPGFVQLEISVAFKGSIKRVLSPAVSVPVWSTFSTSGFNFAYPSSMTTVAPLSDGSGYDIDANDPTSSGQALDILFISAPSSTFGLTPSAWLASNIDPANLLSGLLLYQTQPNGSLVVTVNGAVPVVYTDQYGPLPYAFIFSSDGSEVLSVIEGQEDPLSSLGYSETQITQLLGSVAASISFH